MSLYSPYFRVFPTEGGASISYNVDGSLNFCAEAVVDRETARLIELAIAEGKRHRSREINMLLKDA